MGCCLFASLLAGMPRLGLLIWWGIQPARFNLAFDSFLIPLFGVLFVPWTTIMYVLVAQGGVTGFDWAWVGLGLLIDISSYGGGGVANRRRTTSSAS